MPDPSEFPITEVTGQRVTKDQLSEMYTRYRFASGYCQGRDILEAACGGGLGLRYLARTAQRAVGADIDPRAARMSSDYSRELKNVFIQVADSHFLPYKDNSFDVIVLFDSIYFLQDPAQFLKESYRILRENGTILISSVNLKWPDFNPSPYTTKYLTYIETQSLLSTAGFTTDLFALLPTSQGGKIDRLISLIRRLASKLRLIPSSIKAKEFLKQIFYGTIPVPLEITDVNASYCEPIPLSCFSDTRQFKIFYAVGKKL